jgi:hypothetical protein
VNSDEQFDRTFVALRLVSAKLMEARILAEDLSPRTRQILDEALEHIEYDLADLVKQKIEWDTKEGGGDVLPPPEEGHQPWWRRRRRMWFRG